MSDAIIVALITAGATILCQIFMSKSQHDKDVANAERESAVLNERLEGIKTRLDEHNNYASRIGGLADDMNEIKVTVSALKTDMDWVKNEVRK